MAKPKGLGKGLDALFGASATDNLNNDRLTTAQVSTISPGRYQPRMQMDEDALRELADSIRAQGVIQPVIVREVGLDRYELIAGERRWRASQLAGLTEIPVVVKSISDEVALAMGLIENIQRQNLNAIEEAQGLKRLIDEFGMTHESVAEAIGRSRSSVSNSLRLLGLPESIQSLLHQKQLEMGHVRALLTLDVIDQISLAHKAAKSGWSVREVERKSRELLEDKTKSEPKAIVQNSAQMNALSEKIAQALGMKVEIQSKNAKKGKLILHFANPDDFERVLKKLGCDLGEK